MNKVPKAHSLLQKGLNDLLLTSKMLKVETKTRLDIDLVAQLAGQYGHVFSLKQDYNSGFEPTTKTFEFIPFEHGKKLPLKTFINGESLQFKTFLAQSKKEGKSFILSRDYHLPPRHLLNRRIWKFKAKLWEKHNFGNHVLTIIPLDNKK